MMINNIHSISSLYQSTQTRSTSRTTPKTDQPQSFDEVLLSKTGQDFHELLGKLKETSDVRQDRIDDLTARIENGTYFVQSSDIAASILNTRF